MNIRWNPTTREFEAEFSSDFAGDLEACKTAGFRTHGPPQWVWHAPSPGVAALNRLRENKPQSGLTITSEALEVYQPLAEQYIKNQEVLRQLIKVKKAQKKERDKEQNYTTLVIPEKGYIGAEDLPPLPPFESKIYVPPPPPDTKCHLCFAPVYFYESQEPLTCAWCEVQNGLSSNSHPSRE